MIESLEDMLVRHEGEVLHAYQDSEGYWTIGVGILIDKRGGGITQEESRYLLKNRIQKVAAEAQAFPWYHKLNNPRKQVILNMLYNLGKPRFLKFKRMIAAIEKDDYATAARELMDSKYARQVGQRAVELSTILYTGELS